MESTVLYLVLDIGYRYQISDENRVQYNTISMNEKSNGCGYDFGIRDVENSRSVYISKLRRVKVVDTRGWGAKRVRYNINNIDYTCTAVSDSIYRNIR